ncbi:MAG: hypothetical protein ACOX44_15220 [Limnochordia bacterium]
MFQPDRLSTKLGLAKCSWETGANKGRPPIPAVCATAPSSRLSSPAELWINGRQVGVRICTPYRFNITHCLKSGENTVEVVVFNTLAPYLHETHPTPFVFAGRDVSGMFGPVRLMRYRPS